MTSSSRISLILLVFFLLPTAVFSIKCYQAAKNTATVRAWLGDCSGDAVKCEKTFYLQSDGLLFVSYLCVKEAYTDGWHELGVDQNGTTSYKYVCSTDDCNSPTISITDPGHPPLPPSWPSRRKPICTKKGNNANQQTTPTPSGTKGNGSDPSNPLGGFGALKAADHQSTWMCLMGMMMSWLLLIN